MTMRTNMSKNKDKNSEIPISIVVVGDSHCGKTQLINKFQNFNFSKVRLFHFFVPSILPLPIKVDKKAHYLLRCHEIIQAPSTNSIE